MWPFAPASPSPAASPATHEAAAPAATRAAKASPASTAAAAAGTPLEQRLIRVTKADISRVTVDDLRRVRTSVTDEQLCSAIAVVLETNRFADVLIASSAATWAEAATGVTERQMSLMGAVVRDRMILLYNMLPYVSDEFLSTMGGSFKSAT